MSTAIVRFLVGQDEEKSIVRLNQKLSANLDLIPPGASPPLVKPRSIDDVPILALTLSSKRYGDFELRRLAAQLHDAIKQMPDVSAVTLIGGQRREIRITLDQARLAAYNLSPVQVGGRAWSLQSPPAFRPVLELEPASFVLETGSFCAHADDVRNVVVGVANDKPVFVRDVADVERRRRRTIAIRPLRRRQRNSSPAVTLAVSKRKGTNAVTVAENVLNRAGAPARQRHPLRRPAGHHPELRRYRRGKIQRAAVPHADRGDFGERPDRDHARVARSR